jgi:hypothetical protein
MAIVRFISTLIPQKHNIINIRIDLNQQQIHQDSTSYLFHIGTLDYKACDTMVSKHLCYISQY